MAVVSTLCKLHPVVLYSLLCVCLCSLARDAEHCIVPYVFFWLSALMEYSICCLLKSLSALGLP